MKKILIILWFILILSACNPNETDIDCADGFELNQSGQCMPLCNDGLVLIGDTCEVIIPVCGLDEILNEETLSCDVKPLVCEEPFVNEDGLCVDPNIVLDYSEMTQELKNIFDIYDVSKDEIIDIFEVSNIFHLDLSSLMLSDISFISGFYNLETLNIKNNSISDISSLNGLENLIDLNASNNVIEDVCVLYNKNLETLYINDNLITEIDCLEGHEKISVLDASNNRIRFVGKLNIFPIVQYVDLSHNELTGISGLDRLYFLEHLDISYNHIVLNYSFEDLALSHNLIYLNASYNDMSQIAPFNAVTSLEEFNIDGNSISNISSLVDLVNLKVFTSKGQAIRNIEVIENWISLEEISLEGQYINSMEPLFNVQTLTNVDIRDIDLNYENIFHLIELNSMEINVISGINLDTNGIPILMSKFDTIYAYRGEDNTLTDLGIVAYDIEDGSLENDLISNYYDTSSLSVGEYTLDLSLMDSDGNINEKSIPLVIRDRINMSNLVVFVSFSDYAFYYPPKDFDGYYNIFNGDEFSLKDYYLEISDGSYIINSVFTHEELYFFKSEHARSYYQLESPGNPNGYSSVAEQKERERELVRAIVLEIEENNYIDEDTILDANDDGVIDGITLMFAGYTDNWNQLLWPHTYWLDSKDSDGDFKADSPTINGKYVYKYNMQFIGHLLGEDTLFLGVIAHEVFHLIGAPDFYHYYQDYDIGPLGEWGLMDFSVSTPRHPLQYTKQEYGGFETDVIHVSEDGIYALNRTTLLENNVIVIDLEYSNEFLYIEYRTRVGDYEIDIPTEGTIIYRVDKDFTGNYLGMYDDDYNSLDEVFIFREVTFVKDYLDEGRYIIEDSGDTDNAALIYGTNALAGVGTKIPIFYSDGTEIMIEISIIEQTEDQVKVQINFIE
jgi:M6 family metalloprotease-like protein